MTDANLIDILRAEQARLRISDRALAAAAGMDNSSISKIKAGTRPICLRFLRGVARAMPGIAGCVAQYVVSGDGAQP